MQSFAYFSPTTLSSLFETIAYYGKDARLLAGGTDLIVRLKYDRITPKAVVNIKRIPELDGGIERDGQYIRIGALTLMSSIESHPLIMENLPVLSEAVHTIGSVQIRNRATIAGNICNASPAADSVPPLLIFDTQLVITSPNGQRKVNLKDFILGPGKTALEANEVVKEILIPMPQKDQAAAFARLTRRKGVDLATINVCCLVKSNGQVRFELGAVGPTPITIEDHQQVLASTDLTIEEKKAHIAELMKKAMPISDVRASKAYRQAMLSVLGMRTLTTALDRLSRQ